MKKILSLKIKIIIPVLFILIVVFLASSLVIIDREYKIAKDSLLNSVESYSSLSAGTLVNNYNLYYESGFYQFIGVVDELMELNENVVYYIQILDVNGKILFDINEMIDKTKYDEATSGERYLPEDLIEKADDPQKTIMVFEEEQYVDIIQPYTDEWGRHEYTVRYKFSLSGLEETRNEMIFTAFTYSIIFILISFLFIYFLISKYITSPVGRLIKGVRLMSEGKLGHTVKVTAKDEMGELASAFNKMSKDLDKSQESLQNLLKQKDEFINQLGHDLKTPLMPLTSLLPILEEKEKDSIKKEWFEVLHRNVDYMKSLVLKTLELAKLNSPRTKFSIHLQIHAGRVRCQVLFSDNR